MKTKIKICGICDPKMAKAAIQLGADYIGIMCYKKSKRYVLPDARAAIVDAAKNAGGMPVLVFVDANAEEILSMSHLLNVNTVQLHGAISRQAHQQLPEALHRIYVRSVDENGAIQDDQEQGGSSLIPERDFILYDNLVGGSGESFPWEPFKPSSDMPFFLAGGLTPSNVAKAIAIVHPDVVDVSSGVESAPGIKDLEKIKAFIHAVQGER